MKQVCTASCFPASDRPLLLFREGFAISIPTVCTMDKYLNCDQFEIGEDRPVKELTVPPQASHRPRTPDRRCRPSMRRGCGRVCIR